MISLIGKTALAVLVTSSLFFEDVVAQDDIRINVTGSSTLAPLVNEIAKRYEGINDNSRIIIQTGGSSRGIADVRKGISEVGMVSRALKSGEEDLSGHLVAKDGIALIVHKENTLQEISTQQVRDIYLGKSKIWSDVNGSDQRIVVVNKAAGRSTLEVFLDNFDLEAKEIKPDVIAGENQQVLKTIASTPTAIGYVSIGTALIAKMRNIPIKILSLDGVEPTLETVGNGDYPVIRSLVLVTKSGSKSGHVQEFLKYSQSDSVVDLVEEAGFVYVAN